MTRASSIIPEKTWDLCIVGGGLVAWSTAALALERGRRVLLLEKSGRFGGRASPETRQSFVFGAGFVCPNIELWQRFADRLQLGMEWQSIANGGALLHGPKGWQAAPEELPAWEAFAASPVPYIPHGGTALFLQNLRKYCEAKGDAFYAALEAPVGEIWSKAGRVEKVVLGSGQEITCKDIAWTADAKGLLEVLRGEDLPEAGVARVAWLKKFTKAPSTPSVVLEFAHKNNIADFSETLLLPFTAGEKEDRRYLLGSFLSQRDPSLAPVGKQLSAWAFTLNELEWDDNHEMMKKIRSAKRLLEKAFVGFEASVSDERVLVLEHSFTPVSKRKGDWKPLLDNLFVIADWAAPTGSHWQGVLELLEEQQDALFAPDAG